jgi:hypothetical protein
VWKYFGFWEEQKRKKDAQNSPGGNIVKCFRDGMIYLGSIECIGLRKPTLSAVLIGHMSRIKYSAMDVVTHLVFFK